MAGKRSFRTNSHTYCGASHHRSWLEATSIASLRNWTPQDTQTSRALQEFIRGFDLVDMWEKSQERATYTHYTSRGTSNIGRIYVSRNLSGQERGADTRIAELTDHLAEVTLIALEITTMRCGRIYWKMNTAILCDESFQKQMQQRWAEWSK